MDLDPVTLGAIGAVAVVGATVVVGFGSEKARAKESRARLERMGFQRGLPAGMLTLDPVQALLRPPDNGRPLMVREVWHKQGEDCLLLHLEFVDRRASGPRVAVRSERLRLPRLSLFPRLDQEGMLADLANQAMALLFARVGKQVTFSSPAEFVRHYMVGGPDEEALREFLTEERRRGLGETRSWTLEGEGDLFVLGEMPIGTRGKAPTTAAAEETLIRDAMAALRILACDR